MADNDEIELNIGVNFDEAELSASYEKILTGLSETTKSYLTDALNEMKGAAAKSWGSLPFYSMHDTATGNRVASKAFLTGLSRDLPSVGAEKNSAAYESALMNAVYKSSIPDPMQRYHRLIAEGRVGAADTTHPDTRIGRTIETDYALLSQPWSRDFIREDAETGERYVDFNGMRKYAVNAGLGQWIDPLKEETADNFELINDEIENIEESSTKSDKTFKSWNDTLKGVLGTLTAIGGLTGIVKTFEVAYNAAEKGTTQAATSLPRTRAFVGMNALDVLATQVAGKGIGLGKDAIYNEIVDLSNRREEYKLLGQGLDALFPSLSGVFDNIMGGDNPYEAYKSILTELYGALANADDDTRAQALMLLDKQGLGSAAYIIGSFLSNDKLAAEMGYDPTRLFSLKENPYRGSYGSAEAMLPDLEQLNESIAASYNQMYLDWEAAFGKPFKDWWNATLINTVVPWFEKMLQYVSPEERKKRKEDRDFEFNSLWKVDPITVRYMDEHQRFYKAASEEAIMLNDKQSWDTLSVDKSYFVPAAKGKVAALTTYNPNKGAAGSQARSFLSALETAAKPTAYDRDENGNYTSTSADLFQSRAALALDFLKATGFDRNLSDLKTNDVDTAIVRVVQEYLAEGDTNILTHFLGGSYMQTKEWEELTALLKEYKEYLKERPEKVKEIKISLYNQYGGEIQAKVDEIVNR